MLSPSSLLARLGELKKWQEIQQERLMRQHNLRLQETEKTADLGVSKLNDDDCMCVDEKILSPPKDFKKLLEEKLAEHDGNGGATVNNASGKPKRPFLKKGAGLSRFRMSLDDQKRPFKQKSKKQPQTVALKKPEVVVQTNKNGETNENHHPEMNSFNRRVIAQINRFTTERMNRNENDDSKDLLIFETLEKRAMNSSFSSTNSSIVRMLSSTPQKVSPKKQFKPVIVEEFTENQTADSEFIERLIYQNLHQNSDNIGLLLDNLQNYRGISPTTSVSSCSSVNSDEVCGKQTQDVGTNTENENNNETMLEKELLAQKLEELEGEIERFRFENNKVAQLRRNLEIEQREFERERKKLTAQLENERKELHFEIGEERKKLAKDKMVFEKYTRELKNKPNKQERNEISNLKIEIANLRETQKLKDTKNSTTQARLRNQIKSLEKEKSNLQEEIEKLTKQNAKLLAAQKVNVARPCETKMLQEINKSLSKLTKVRKNKQAASSEEEVAEKLAKKPAKSVSFERTRKLSTEKSDGEEEESRFLFYGSGSKENDLNVLNSFEGFDIERHYEEVFGRNADLNGHRVPNTTVNDSRKDDSNETTLSDGSKEIHYTNGNTKTVSPDGNIIKTKYYNGDLKETNLREGYIKYFYCETKAWQTTHADGTEIFEFPNGQIERKLNDGSSEIKFPDGVVRKIRPDGTEEIVYLDGSVVTVQPNGDRVLLLPNGQKEIHTKEHKRREYPGGTIKILYPDGTQETRYSNGRIRIKDEDGKLLMDSFS